MKIVNEQFPSAGRLASLRESGLLLCILAEKHSIKHASLIYSP
jgi:hypothetical protein